MKKFTQRSKLPPCRRHALVLLSGGMDSTACLHFYSSRGFAVSTVFMDYGQRAAAEEHRAAAAVSSYFKVPHKNLKIDGATKKESGVIRGRNAFLLLSALAEWEEKATGLIVTGIHAGTRYPECEDVFHHGCSSGIPRRRPMSLPPIPH